MQAAKLIKLDTAKKMVTGRSELDRVLDPDPTSWRGSSAFALCRGA
jgi:hypothetical protein